MITNKRSNSKSFVIWNQKGGVGKSTLLYYMSLNYARNNPNKRVLIIDMCPQADISSAFLKQHLTVVQNKMVNTHYPLTVRGYLSYITYPRGEVRFRDWSVRLKKYDDTQLKNVHLMCGDNLRCIVKELENKANAPKSAEIKDPWRFVTESMRKLVDKVMEEDDWVVFIDTNPNFSIFTDIALVAADLLLIPINADAFSFNGLLNVFKLVYGIHSTSATIDEQPTNSNITTSGSKEQPTSSNMATSASKEQDTNSNIINDSPEYELYQKVKIRNMALPKVCSIILVGGNANETMINKVFSDAALKDSFKFYNTNKEIFAQSPYEIQNENEFENIFLAQFPKFNSVGVLSISKGVLPLDLKSSENLNGINVPAAKTQKDKLQLLINKLTEMIIRWINPQTPSMPFDTSAYISKDTLILNQQTPKQNSSHLDQKTEQLTSKDEYDPVSNYAIDFQRNNKPKSKRIDSELESISSDDSSFDFKFNHDPGLNDQNHVQQNDETPMECVEPQQEAKTSQKSCKNDPRREVNYRRINRHNNAYRTSMRSSKRSNYISSSRKHT